MDLEFKKCAFLDAVIFLFTVIYICYCFILIIKIFITRHLKFIDNYI